MKETVQDIFLKLTFNILKNYMSFIMIDHFLPERMKIPKVEKFDTNLSDKTEYVIHIRNLKQALDHGLILKKVCRVIKFNQNAWLKPCIHMNTQLRQKAKSNFEKNSFKLMNNAVFGKTMKNVRKQRHIKRVTTEKKKKLYSIKTKLSNQIITSFSQKVY